MLIINHNSPICRDIDGNWENFGQNKNNNDNGNDSSNFTFV